MLNKEFLLYLSQKLKSGNRASIHLNALPSNYVTRLDLNRLNILFNDNGKTSFLSDSEQQTVGDEFLDKLFNIASFSLDLNFWEQSLQTISDEQKEHLKFLAKRLDSIYYQSIDNYLEYGIKTFGFGYPLIIKRDRRDPTKIIKAPLLVWKLEIEKSKQSPNNWTIRKDDDFPIAVNEILMSQIYSDDSMVLEAIPHEYLVDNIIQKEELINLCNKILNQLNATNISNEVLKLEKCPTALKIEEIVNHKAYIQWSGVFGIYKNQKQSLIKELETLANNIDGFNFEETEKHEFKSKLSGVETDPSQERIINNFAESTLKIIQGPPGTGKSQTISAIITNALENQKKCLVICEKKTAIEVIFNNLDKIGIGSFCAVIDDINKDRERIIQLARSKIELEKPSQFPEHLYLRNIATYEKLKKQINEKLAKSRKPCFGDFNHKELVGLFLENYLIANYEYIGNVIDPVQYHFNYNEYEDLLEIIRKASKEAEKANAENSGLNIIKDEIFLSQPSEKLKYEILVQIQELHQLVLKVKAVLDKFIELADNSYDKKAFLQDLGSSTIGLFSKKISNIHKLKKDIWKAYINLSSEYQHIDCLKDKLIEFDSFKYYSEMSNYISLLDKSFEKCLNDYTGFRMFQEWKRHFYFLPVNAQKLISIISKLPLNLRESAFKSWYLDESLKTIFYAENLQEVYDDLQELVNLNNPLKLLQNSRITSYWQKRQKDSVLRFEEQTGSIKRLYNFRRNSEFGRKNALRQIIGTDFDLFSDFFPVILTNPVACSSVLPMKSNLFDIVIFDEASQLRIEDTYTAYLRGRYKVISGDRHQMPPSSYFQSAQAISIDGQISEEFEESIYLAESESLLEFAQEQTIHQTYLEFHYRSRHPYLIDFSNAAFYGNRLVPMPIVKPYKPIRFISVDGIYHDGVNIIEAEAVIDILAKHVECFEDGTMPSIGVATTNIYQRNLIWDRITERCFIDPKFSRKFARINANQFFVKNLENIQGDERDILIISTTFGPDQEGNFNQNFGPLNQANGYRLLNVIITRAKHKLFVCSSIPPAMFSNYRNLIETNGNNGRGIFYAYLAYAYAIEQENDTERQNMMAFLAANSNEGSSSIMSKATAGPFELAIYNYLNRYIDKERIKSFYPFGGFFLDTVVLSDNPDKQNIAMECNGGHNFEDEEAYIHLQYRQKLLENYGFEYLHLWSLAFWQNPEGELEHLSNKVNSK